MAHSAKKWRIVIGSDDAGETYKNLIRKDLESDPRVESVVDAGATYDRETPYPDIAIAGARKINDGTVDRAILICGTGLGMAISANKVPGIRAVTAHDSYSVERSILSNNCQVLALGQRVIGPEVARRLVREWLGYVFDPNSPSQAKVARIGFYEENKQ